LKPLLAWAMRDLLRRPEKTILLAVVLAVTVTVSATALLLTRSLALTAEALLSGAPAMVVRKIGPGGWEPIPVDEAMTAAIAVPGVTGARPRCWGVLSGPEIPVTVIGGDESMVAVIGRLPGRGEAIAGPGIGRGAGEMLRLSGSEGIDLTIIAAFGPEMGMAVHDVVMLDPADARRILGLPGGYASDLAIDVFHAEEATAILPDLAAAFPWPVKITTRTETTGYYAAAGSKRGGLIMITMIPVLFALALIVYLTVREKTGRRHEVGLLKAFGWTTRDIVALQGYQALFIALPAAAVGLLIAYALVAWPGITWPAYFFLGWDRQAPGLYLQMDGAIPVLLEVAALVVVPFVAAVLWPALRSAAIDPQDLVEGGMVS